MTMNALKNINRILAIEEYFAQKLASTRIAKQLQNTRGDLLEAVRTVGRSGDLSLIVSTERAIVEGDLARYANSPSMTSSLKNAITEIAAIERHISTVNDPAQYKAVDHAYSLPKNRKVGLPNDEARQALASHYARLNNMDKSRLGDDEKKVIDARKAAIFNAGKLYAERQAKTLGVDPVQQGKKQGRRLSR